MPLDISDWKMIRLRLDIIITIMLATYVGSSVVFGIYGLQILRRTDRAIGVAARMASTLERMETRFHEFADETLPVVGAGAEKAVESLKKLDADAISEKATDRIGRFLDKDRQGN